MQIHIANINIYSTEGEISPAINTIKETLKSKVTPPKTLSERYSLLESVLQGLCSKKVISNEEKVKFLNLVKFKILELESANSPKKKSLPEAPEEPITEEIDLAKIDNFLEDLNTKGHSSMQDKITNFKKKKRSFVSEPA